MNTDLDDKLNKQKDLIDKSSINQSINQLIN